MNPTRRSLARGSRKSPSTVLSEGVHRVDAHGYRLIDLANATGASFTQIRRWVTLGIVDGAVKAGKFSYYPHQCKDQIIAARDAYDRNVTWRDIKDRLHPPDDSPESAYEFADDGALG
jgi:hypothetical protein